MNKIRGDILINTIQYMYVWEDIKYALQLRLVCKHWDYKIDDNVDNLINNLI